MALSTSSLQPLIVFPLQQRRIPSKVRFIRSKPHFNQEKSQLQLFSSYRTYHCLFRANSASVSGYSMTSDDTNSSQEYAKVALSDKLKKWIKFLREIFPGGEWWRLSSEEIDVGLSSKPVTVLRALQKMWELIAQDRWVIYTAFVALIVAALSEISIPHYLTASIFSAESSKVALFHQNVRLLVMLCITAGVFSGIRGCMFGIANMILVSTLTIVFFNPHHLSTSESIGNRARKQRGCRTCCKEKIKYYKQDALFIFFSFLEGAYIH